MNTKIKLKKLSSNAKLPTKGKPGDFCYDVWAVSEEEIAPNVWMYRFGFKYEIERGFIYYLNEYKHPCYVGKNLLDEFDISIDFRPRSSIWETGMVLSNSPGTLDELFRGEGRAIFYHVMPNMPRYHVGDKIGQIKLGLTLKNVEFEWADDIDENTERGEGGFGSTGKQ